MILSFRPAFTKFPKHVLAAAPDLRMICISGTGVEDVDVAEATARKIAVANVPGPLPTAPSQSIASRCCFRLRATSVRRTAPSAAANGKAMQGIELGGKTLGVVGVSGISSELVLLARGLGMKVISWSRSNDPARASAIGSQAVSFDELLASADVVSLHVRLNDTTRHMIGADQLARMKRGAILINTARGGVVDDSRTAACIGERSPRWRWPRCVRAGAAPGRPPLSHTRKCCHDASFRMEHCPRIRAYDQPEH